MIFSRNNINYLIAITAAITTSFHILPDRALANNLDRHLRHPKKRSTLAIKKNKPQNFNLLAIRKNLEANKLKKVNDKNKLSVSNKNLNIPIKKGVEIARAVDGEASWYGGQFHGRPTASGEIFNQNDLTAAHRYLPFGTKVKVTNVNTGSSVIVRINDRGPFAKGRVIDLSAAAAQAIGLITSGVAPVQISILDR